LRQPKELAHDEQLLEKYLWTHELGELAQVDLVIRTSGEKRISNFLLWQAAYTEYFFTDLCWPDFHSEHLQAAIDDFVRRERRFGGVEASTGGLTRSVSVEEGQPFLQTQGAS
jgi:undecaprenyl diphosphate synthase